MSNYEDIKRVAIIKEEDCFYGLGYDAANPSSGVVIKEEEEGVDESNHNEEDTSGNTVDLMQQYLKDCLAYHQEEKLKQQQENEGTSNKRIKIEQEPLSSLPQQQQQDNHEQQQQVETIIQEGRSRIQEILLKFHQQQQQHEPQPDPSVSTTATIIEQHIQPPPPNYYRIQRELFWKEFEKQKLHVSLFKNFEYIHEKQKRIYEQETITNLNSIQQYETNMQKQYQYTLQQRKLKQQQQQKHQFALLKQKGKQLLYKNDKNHNKNSQDKKKKNNSKKDSHSEVTLYVSGLPATDNDNDPTHANDDATIQKFKTKIISTILRPLFGSYGNILKIHLYQNKLTNELKGDALVIYQLQDNEDHHHHQQQQQDNSNSFFEQKRQQLISTVCSQVRVFIPCFTNFVVVVACFLLDERSCVCIHTNIHWNVFHFHKNTINVKKDALKFNIYICVFMYMYKL